jgi:hypothetical protein
MASNSRSKLSQKQQPPDCRSRDRLSRIVIIVLLASVGILAGLWLSGGMRKIYAWYTLRFALPVLGLLSLLLIAFFAVVRRRWSGAILAALLVSVLAIPPAAINYFPVAFPASLEHTTPSATVRLPANVPLQVAWGGDKLANNQHAIVPDQRWAYDFVVAPYFTGSSRLEDYGCYGIPVVAPASALVTDAHDGEPDAVPGVSPHNTTAPKGNYVVIQLEETGTYLLIAHLRPGSVAVTAGETVAEGQAIGQCGNSGNTSEPHIHIHHQRQDPSIYPIGFAEGLPLYFRDTDGPPMPEGGFRTEGDQDIPLGPVVRHIGK